MEIYGSSTSHAVSSNALAFCRALECEWFLVPWAAGHQVRQLYWSLLGALHANSFCLNIAGLVWVLIILILDDFVHVNVQTQASPSTQKQMYSGYMLINFESIWWDMRPHFLSHWRRLHDCILALTLWCPCCSTKEHILWWFEAPSLWWLVGYIMLNPHHLVVKSSLSGSFPTAFQQVSNRFPTPGLCFSHTGYLRCLLGMVVACSARNVLNVGWVAHGSAGCKDWHSIQRTAECCRLSFLEAVEKKVLVKF